MGFTKTIHNREGRDFFTLVVTRIVSCATKAGVTSIKGDTSLIKSCRIFIWKEMVFSRSDGQGLPLLKLKIRYIGPLVACSVPIVVYL